MKFMTILVVTMDSHEMRLVDHPLYVEPIHHIDRNFVALLNSTSISDLPGLLEELSGSADYLTQHHEPVAWIDMIKADWHPQIRDKVCECT